MWEVWLKLGCRMREKIVAMREMRRRENDERGIKAGRRRWK